MSLESLGWSKAFQSYNLQDDSIARIIAVHRSHFRAITINGEINIHHSSGFSQSLAVGDWVVTTPFFTDDQGESAALVKELIPRKSKLSRMSAGEQSQEQLIAANVDTVFVVTSINQDFNISRLQRYVLIIKKGGARPVIVLSKTDLKSSYTQIMADLKAKLDKEILVLPISLINKVGIEQIKTLLPVGSTSVFVGSSGVGKSSLVNFLLGQEAQHIQEIRVNDGKGKHTTTSRQMFFIPDGGMIIDTPGIRDVGVFNTETNLSETFSEIEELLTHCKFSDCHHITEPGCAILQALETQQLEKKQWDNYNKLSKEIAINNSKMNKKLSSDSKKKWKQTKIDYKSPKKNKDRG